MKSTTLALIVLIAGLFFLHHQKTRDKAVRMDGRHVVDLLSNPFWVSIMARAMA
ncbi:MAG: hypothetical protein QX198_14605 [Methylococcaceae bacterium]